MFYREQYIYTVNEYGSQWNVRTPTDTFQGVFLYKGIYLAGNFYVIA